MQITTDFLVIGSGVSGLLYALKVAEYGTVALVTKREINDTNTRHAQGGLAAVWDSHDTYSSHINDTLKAGAGLCHPDVVKEIIEAGTDCVKTLVNDYNVKFDLDSKGEFELGLEGAHSFRRILHAKDFSGWEIQKKLSDAARQHSNIQIFEHHIAINLFVENGKCYGAYVLNSKTGEIFNFSAAVTVLATGGAGKVFLVTTNPDTACGDGIAMAYRAGATVMNMEFIQFHPTCLYHPYAKSFLISEALRGEGAILIDKQGNRFMEKYHPLKDLAPRDIVTRSIDNELKSSGEDCVYLDIRHKGSSFIKDRFPSIYENCLKLGIDITSEPIPVVPAAHYTIGGVKATPSGVTDIQNLLAIGECSCTGLHGANRLASNSLLEGAVCAYKASSFSRNLLKSHIQENPITVKFPEWDYGSAEDSNERVFVSQNWHEIRQFMWSYVGILRSNKRLDRARKRIKMLLHEINEYYWDFTPTADLIELRNLAQVADLIIQSASSRKESRGVHFSLDYPLQSNEALDTELQIAMVRKRKIA